MSSAADRNLLFGILALQNHFLDESALIAAMKDWLCDKAKPLGDILLEQGRLNTGRRELCIESSKRGRVSFLTPFCPAEGAHGAVRFFTAWPAGWHVHGFAWTCKSCPHAMRNGAIAGKEARSRTIGPSPGSDSVSGATSASMSTQSRGHATPPSHRTRGQVLHSQPCQLRAKGRSTGMVS